MVTAGSEFAHGETAANLNMAYSSSSPVDAFPPSESGHRDTIGNNWEWTEDHFNPLKNFEVHHVYDDFRYVCSLEVNVLFLLQWKVAGATAPALLAEINHHRC
eukprot:scaffold2851_cov61-Skeletonema_dohrnii-CCMP3373.AAC.1